MRIATFNSFASKIRAGGLDTIEPESRERIIVDTLKANSWTELVGYTVGMVVMSAWGIAVAWAIFNGYSIPKGYPLVGASSALVFLTLFENGGRARVKKAFIARYKKDETIA